MLAHQRSNNQILKLACPHRGSLWPEAISLASGPKGEALNPGKTLHYLLSAGTFHLPAAPTRAITLMPLVKAGGRGVRTPLRMLGQDFVGAGWHARMSSRQR